MTYTERLEFFEKVKGKKIRWTSWHGLVYFIPEQLIDETMVGTTHRPDGRSLPAFCYINEGFSPRLDEDDNYYWEFFEEPDKTQPKTKVCECGKDKHGFASHSDWCPLYEE